MSTQSQIFAAGGSRGLREGRFWSWPSAIGYWLSVILRSGICYWLFVEPRRMVIFMGKLRISAAAGLLLLGGCAHQPMTETIAVSGGQYLTFTRVGAGFIKAENERLVVDEAGLTTYRTEGKNFVRWQFAILPKRESGIRLVRIEDVTGDRPVLILEDRDPQIDERRWSHQSPLIRANPRSIPWLFEFGRTTRVFRIVVRETNGKTSILYQAVLFTPKAKKDFRVLMGPETVGTP
jgi:hypothetical protein